MLRFFLFFVLFFCGPIIVSSKEFVAKSDGIYAIIKTDVGEMVAELYYEEAPRTVANFVGLAEGSLPWFDLEKNEVATKPFYENLLFHRVVHSFMIQTGSASGSGKDGPGYWFEDEFSRKARHDRVGILSMANFGPDRNGSQFFITLDSAPYLNKKHSVFGRLIRGNNYALKIGRQKIDSKNRPIEAVYLQSIEIMRIGEAAREFDPTQYDLPAPKLEEVLAIGE